MATIRLRFNSGTDTEARLELSIDNVVITHTAITRARIQTADGIFRGDSLLYPSAWDFSNAGYIRVLGGKLFMPPGIYTRAQLVTHDPNAPDGIAWPDFFTITVI